MYNHLPSPINFREDINGLRAWAVIAVLLFHFSLIGLPGGFVGVDVFFVISGYLMTAIVVGKIEKGSFSLIDFYMARVRRILPVLLVVISTLLVLGWFWLPTPDYQELGKQSAYSLAFLSNIGYWKSSGYFDSGAHEKWLLHTWSLAVEAQFYILYPLMISFIWKVWNGIKPLTVLLVIIFILSFSLNLTYLESQPTLTFYFFPTRGWELVAGGLVFLVATKVALSKNSATLAYWSGWGLLLYSLFFINQNHPWPGYWALLPVIGTSLIIFSNNSKCTLTNNYLSQWVGDRSYSLYLWHWPLVVALYFSTLQNNWGWVLSIFALSFLLAHLSYILIEVPTRKKLSKYSLKKEILVIAAAILMLGICSVIIKYSIFENRIDPNIDMLAMEALNKNIEVSECGWNRTTNFWGKSEEKICKFGKKNTRPSLILIGDSHSEAIATALAESAKRYNASFLYLGGGNGCPFTNIYDPQKSRCYSYKKEVQSQLNNLTQDIPLLIVNSGGYILDTNNYPQRLEKTLCDLKESSNRKIYVTTPITRFYNLPEGIPQRMSRDFLFNGKATEITVSRFTVTELYHNVSKAQENASSQCGIELLRTEDYLCDSSYCYGSKNLKPLYYNNSHLSEDGNKALELMFDKIFKSSENHYE